MVIPNEHQSEVFNKIMPLDKLERSIEFYSTQSYQKETFRSNLTHYSFKKLESPMAAIERKMFESNNEPLEPYQSLDKTILKSHRELQADDQTQQDKECVIF